MKQCPFIALFKLNGQKKSLTRFSSTDSPPNILGRRTNLTHPKSSWERGSALIMVFLLMSLLVFIPIGAQLLKTARQEVRLYSNTNTQALNVARAGLEDTIAWFRRQNSGLPVRDNDPSSYPDNAFAPSAASFDTQDAAVGLVKTGFLSPDGTASDARVQYRYEVVRQSTGVYNPRAVHDITGQRMEGHAAGEGLVWYIESVGYVFADREPGYPVNVGNNYLHGKNLIGRARVATEIRRINMVPTARAALIIENRNNGTVGANAFIMGGSPQSATSAYGVAPHTGTTGTWPVAQVKGLAPAILTASTTYRTDTQSILGMSPAELSLLADYTNINALPTRFPMALVYLSTPTANFTAAKPLKGAGVLVVQGNLNIAAYSNSLFTGLVLVTGNVTIRGSANITGTLIVGGSLDIADPALIGNPVYIQYDSGALNMASTLLAGYRESKAMYHVFSSFK
jgi:hypothetical protein